MIVRTADKTGYILFPQHTMKTSSDCNKKVIISCYTFYISPVLFCVQSFYRAWDLDFY